MSPGETGAPARRGAIAAALLAALLALALAGMIVTARGIYAEGKLAATAVSEATLRLTPNWNSAPNRVLVIGDSRVARWRPGAPAAGSALATSGVGGETSAQLLARWRAGAQRPAGATLLILTGVNDLVAADLNPHKAPAIEAALARNVLTIAAEARAAGMVPVIGAVGQAARVDWGRRLLGWSGGLNRRIDRANAGLRTQARAAGHGWFDVNAALGVGDDRIMPPRHALDTLHWTDAAYRALESALAERLPR